MWVVAVDSMAVGGVKAADSEVPSSLTRGEGTPGYMCLRLID